jgi:hypothetical protein
MYRMEPQLQKHVSNDRNNEVWTLIALSTVYYYRAHTKLDLSIKRIYPCSVATVLPMRGGALTKRSRTLTAGAPGT